MRHSGRCPSARWLAEYSDGQLRGRRDDQIERHLQQCEQCRQEVARLRRLRELLQSMPTPRPSADLPARVEAVVGSLHSLPALSCRQAHLLISADLDEEIEPQDQQRLWAHLFNCPRCLRRYRETQRMVTVARRPVAVPVPGDLPARILAAVQRVGTCRPAHRVAPARLGLAAALAVVGVILLSWALWAPAPPTPETTQFAEVTQSVEPPTLPEVTSPPEPGSETEVAAQPPKAAGAAHTFRPSRAVREQRERAEASRAAVPEMRVPPTRGESPARAVAGAQPPRPVTAPGRGPGEEPPSLGPSLPAAHEPEASPRPAPPTPPPPGGEPTLAALPPKPAPTPAAHSPAETGLPSPASEPLVVHSPPQSTRELRWTPVQPPSVVVYEGESSDPDVSLAQAAKALNQYAERLERGKAKKLEIWH